MRKQVCGLVAAGAVLAAIGCGEEKTSGPKVSGDASGIKPLPAPGSPAGEGKKAAPGGKNTAD